jgi:hypothetical protein
LTIDGEKIETTDEHPFWVDGDGWVKAKDLRTGDQLVTDNNLTLPITNIKIVKKHVTVYNFKVKDYHSYYVTNIAVWTHNSCKLKPAKKNKGRGGRQQRLKSLADDDRAPKHVRGYIKTQMRHRKTNGRKRHLTNPPGFDLAHKRGYEARKGYNYSYTVLQNKANHKLQHKYDHHGRKR